MADSFFIGGNLGILWIIFQRQRYQPFSANDFELFALFCPDSTFWLVVCRVGQMTQIIWDAVILLSTVILCILLQGNESENILFPVVMTVIAGAIISKRCLRSCHYRALPHVSAL